MPDMTEEEKRIRAEAKRRAEEAARRREEQALLDLKQAEMDAKMSGSYKRAQGQSVSGMMRGGSVQKYAKGGYASYQEGGDVKSKLPASKGVEISGITRSVGQGEKLPGEGSLFARMDESDVDVLSGLVRRSRKKFDNETGEMMRSGGMTTKNSRDGCAIKGRTKGRNV